MASSRPGPIWTCHPDTLTCPNGHPLLWHKQGFRVRFVRVDGEAFVRCGECADPSYFFAAFVHEPAPLAICYAISKESYVYWIGDRAIPARDELLHLLADPAGRSYNPTFPRVRRTSP